jgi:flagellar biosynthetic protein FlhB
VFRVLVAMLAAQAAIAAPDVVWERVRHGRGLRTSRQELKDEHRETHGDPLVKGASGGCGCSGRSSA